MLLDSFRIVILKHITANLRYVSTMRDIIYCRCGKKKKKEKEKTSAWCEQKWPKIAAFFPLESSPRWSSLTSVSVRFSVHTTQESDTKTDPICDDSLSKPKQPSIAPAQKVYPKSELGFVCERKPYPTCFWCRHKSYSAVWCRHSLCHQIVTVKFDAQVTFFQLLFGLAKENYKNT